MSLAVFTWDAGRLHHCLSTYNGVGAWAGHDVSCRACDVGREIRGTQGSGCWAWFLLRYAALFVRGRYCGKPTDKASFSSSG